MYPTVYVETTIVSYLTARPSTNPIRVGHAASTSTWWNTRRFSYDLFTSLLVIDEAASGDAEAAAKRLAILHPLSRLPIPDSATTLASALLARAALPQKARADALHVAICAVHGINYLLTWNCRHLANVTLRSKIEAACRDQGYEPPLICTPLELTEVQL
jgi:predicted nucleic acid-binding protein